MMVKICGITNLDDALAAADGGAAALGFNFYRKSPRYIPPEEAARITKALPAAVWKVGVFVNEAPEAVEEMAARIGLDVAQLHGDESAAAVPAGVRVWKALRVDASFGPASLEPYRVEAFLLDAPAPDVYGGSGGTFDWSKVAGLGRKIIVAGGLDAGNVREAIRRARPWGVDACSRLESAPGRKDREKMRAFLRAALAREEE
jgi:phosphoribosylanthranilate isomerase